MSGADYLAVTERFVAAHFPGASIAIVAGSTARGERTATSDIDLLLLGEALFTVPGQTSIATTRRFEGEEFEVFGYTPDGFEEWGARDVAQYRPVIVNMLLDGVAVRADSSLETLRSRWSGIRDAGPQLTPRDLELPRYIVTDLLDDLRDMQDPAEQLVVATLLFERIAQLMLVNDGRWIATGKHLPRALRAMDAARADALLDPWLASDFAAFADAVSAELERAGGRLQDGFIR